MRDDHQKDPGLVLCSRQAQDRFKSATNLSFMVSFCQGCISFISRGSCVLQVCHIIEAKVVGFGLVDCQDAEYSVVMSHDRLS